MDITTRFILFQVLIIAPFAAGMAAKRRWRFRNLPAFTKRLIRVNLVLIEPVIVLWSTWGLVLTKDLVMLPLAGLFLVAAGMAFGGVIRGPLGMSGKKGGTFLISSSLANHGFTMGGFLCYFFLGESGLGLSVILVLYFIPYVYCLVFPYARAGAGQRILFTDFFKKIAYDIQSMPLFAMAAGLLLNTAGIKRPAIAFPLDAVLLASISLYYLALGISFTRVDVRGIRRELAALSVIKFAVVPGAACAVLSLLPLDPALKAVIQLQAFMPAAIYSMVTAVLFDLDTDLASGLFVCNTVIFLTAVLPVIFVFKKALFAM